MWFEDDWSPTKYGYCPLWDVPTKFMNYLDLDGGWLVPQSLIAFSLPLGILFAHLDRSTSWFFIFREYKHAKWELSVLPGMEEGQVSKQGHLDLNQHNDGAMSLKSRNDGVLVVSKEGVTSIPSSRNRDREMIENVSEVSENKIVPPVHGVKCPVPTDIDSTR